MSTPNPFSDPSLGLQAGADKAKSSPGSSNPFSDPSLGVEPSRSATDYVRDAAAMATKAAIAVPEAAVGLADIVSGGKAGKALQSGGFDPKRAKEIANEWSSDATKAAQDVTPPPPTWYRSS